MSHCSALALLYSKKLELQWPDRTPDAEAVKHRLFLDDPYLSRNIPSSLEFDAEINPIYLSTQPTNTHSFTMHLSTITASLLLAALSSATPAVRRQEESLCTTDYPELSCCTTTATELASADCKVGS